MKLRYILILPILLAACTGPGDVRDTEFRFEAGVQELETKVELGARNDAGKYPLLWSAADKIQINSSVSEPLDAAYDGKQTATFIFPQTPASAASYIVTYPAAGEGIIRFPGQQNHVEGTISPGAMPLCGRTGSLDGGVSLRACGTVVGFEFKGSATLLGMEFSCPGGEKLSGDFTLSGSADELVPSGSASGGMNYSFGDGLALSQEGTDILFTVPLGSYSKGIKAIVRSSDGSSMALSFFTSGVELPTTRVCRFPAISYQAGKEIAFTAADAFSAGELGLEGSAGTSDMESRDASAAASIKAGSYNIWSPEARKTVMDGDATVSEQRSWANSYSAVADMIKWLDCDVMGLQEITSRGFYTSITGAREDYDGNVHTLNSKLPGYSWVIYNGANTTYDSLFPRNTTANGLSNTEAIIYKSSVLTLISSGRYWLTGKRTEAGAPADGYGTNRVAVWAKFTHKASGKQFVFVSTHLDLPNAGSADDPYLAQRRNIEKLIGWVAPQVCPGNLPSVIVGDMNVDAGDGGGNYDRLVSGRWKDVYDIMLSDGSLSYNDQRLKGTMNASKNEEGWSLSSWRADHILADGFTPSYYKVGRETFATADGTQHWPSDHFPIKVILNF